MSKTKVIVGVHIQYTQALCMCVRGQAGVGVCAYVCVSFVCYLSVVTMEMHSVTIYSQLTFNDKDVWLCWWCYNNELVVCDFGNFCAWGRVSLIVVQWYDSDYHDVAMHLIAGLVTGYYQCDDYVTMVTSHDVMCNVTNDSMLLACAQLYYTQTTCVMIVQ